MVDRIPREQRSRWCVEAYEVERVPRFIEAESSCNLRQTNELAGQFGLSGVEEET
jgi:hypothetical protein